MANANRAMLERMAADLGTLRTEVVFVGGQITELLITDPAAVRIRPTIDVDVIVTTTSRTAFHQVEERLRALGFSNDHREGAPLCRWISPRAGILDLMPVDPSILGFSNRWYTQATLRTITTALQPGLEIRHPTAAVFLATKLAAFQSRGRADLFGSHDLEDVITLVAGRRELPDELPQESRDLREWVGAAIHELLSHRDFSSAIQGALPDVATIPDYLESVQSRFQLLVATP